ncbi:Tocopherol cyclase [Mycolicibacterium rutilum]|uniref:Tocopherol cyclase n=1 Tax=Mycolicibacterium rutilum TaxID=370526 RepID=A0A1H6J0A9_MYCRU|nr:tocopherol cyclase family protein [Mycolicibacterium rutilum]SEH52844.1 Tocopherol cyclase [Mycolicibacterium rutilum]
MTVLDATRDATRLVAGPFAHLYRRSGADLPFSDPLTSHGTEMEGWFWRFTDAASGRAVIALFSVNKHPDGDWATTAVALHPGGRVYSAALPSAGATADPFRLDAGDGQFSASYDRLRVDLPGVCVDMRFDAPVRWPKALGGGGIASAVPFLNQYWHPYRLGGSVSGTVDSDGERWTFDGAKLYTERNWGAGFPERWWWGQAHDFGDADVSVAFSGGLLALGPLKSDVGGVVVRMGRKVLRMTPPTAWVRSDLGRHTWRVQATSLRYHVELFGDGTHLDPHTLPVPLPAERRNIDSDYEHLAGRLRCRVTDFGRVVFDGESEIAGLEVGSRPGG